jgi:hypothetical protein
VRRPHEPVSPGALLSTNKSSWISLPNGRPRYVAVQVVPLPDLGACLAARAPLPPTSRKGQEEANPDWVCEVVPGGRFPLLARGPRTRFT